MKPARTLREALRRARRVHEEAGGRDRSSLGAGPAPIVFRRDLPVRGRGPQASPAPSADLEEIVDGRVVRVPGFGRAFLVEGRAPMPDFPSAPPGPGTLWFDIEATGLTSTPLFLVGTMRREGDDLVTRQFLARDYSEEAAVIALFTGEAVDAELLVSFNGKSYDLPYLRTRAAATGVPFSVDLPHGDLAHRDLLHESRREWAGTVPNCRLGTLETFVLGRPRTDDIPGADIPEAYHEFVRSGDATDMARIVEHNRVDLVSMAELQARLPDCPLPGNP